MDAVRASPNRSWLQRVVVFVAAAVVIAGTARLGFWQLDRAAQKQALQRSLDTRSQLPAVDAATLADSAGAAAEQHYRRTVVRGQWVPHATVFLDNRQMNARQGFFVVTPLRLSEAPGVVLVQRGWVPRDLLDRSKLPTLPDAPGEVIVRGHIAPPPGRLYEFAGAASGVIRQNLNFAVYAREWSLPLKPMSIVQDADGAPTDGLLRQWPRPDVGIQRHHGYAFQWFALCALMTGLYVWFQLLRPRLRSKR